MNNLSFLLIVVVISVPACLYLWLRARKPTTFMSSIDEFQKEMTALANDPSAEPERKRAPQPLRPIVSSQPNHGLGEKIRTAHQQRQSQQGLNSSRGAKKRTKKR